MLHTLASSRFHTRKCGILSCERIFSVDVIRPTTRTCGTWSYSQTRRCSSQSASLRSTLHESASGTKQLQSPHSNTASNASACHAQRFPMERSSFVYEGAEKGTDIGARNEAAYIPYKSFVPSIFSWKRRIGMPSYNNIMTTIIVELGIIFTTVTAVSILLWSAWVQRKYEVVRPTRAAS